MRVLPDCISVYHEHSWSPQRYEEGIKSSNLLELELPMVVRRDVGSGNQTRVLYGG